MERAASLSQIFDRGVSLSLFVTEEAPEPENEKKNNGQSIRKCDFSLPVLVPLLEMGRLFPALVNCAFGYLQIHSLQHSCESASIHVTVTRRANDKVRLTH